ncbi:MAG: serine/threonine-protein kinase [Colwellia sp.]
MSSSFIRQTFMGRIKPMLNHFNSSNAAIDVDLEFLIKWTKLSKQAGYIVLAFALLNLLGLANWIEQLSYALFPTYETKQFMGLVSQYETNAWRAPFVIVMWILCLAIFTGFLLNALKNSLIEAFNTSCSDPLSKKPLPIKLESKKEDDSYLDKTVLVTQELVSKHEQVKKEEKIALEKQQNEHRYRITSELGQGAMGVVYLAQDTVLHREVALKSLSMQLATQQSFSKRFYQEARMVAKLNHPNIVQIYDFIEQSDKFMIAMELVKGSALDEVILDEKLSKEQVFKIAKQIAMSMEYAHQQGVIHRDLKPANVLITYEGKVKLTDFGLAKINGTNETQVGVIMGSPLYMSPEQAKGELVDSRADIYAFGIMLYQLLVGKLPYSGTTTLEVISQHLTQPLPLGNTELSESEAELLTLLTQKSPEQRPQSFTTVIEGLELLESKYCEQEI